MAGSRAATSRATTATPRSASTRCSSSSRNERTWTRRFPTPTAPTWRGEFSRSWTTLYARSSPGAGNGTLRKPAAVRYTHFRDTRSCAPHRECCGLARCRAGLNAAPSVASCEAHAPLASTLALRACGHPSAPAEPERSKPACGQRERRGLGDGITVGVGEEKGYGKSGIHQTARSRRVAGAVVEQVHRIDAVEVVLDPPVARVGAAADRGADRIGVDAGQVAIGHLDGGDA